MFPLQFVPRTQPEVRHQQDVVTRSPSRLYNFDKSINVPVVPVLGSDLDGFGQKSFNATFVSSDQQKMAFDDTPTLPPMRLAHGYSTATKSNETGYDTLVAGATRPIGSVSLRRRRPRSRRGRPKRQISPLSHLSMVHEVSKKQHTLLSLQRLINKTVRESQKMKTDLHKMSIRFDAICADLQENNISVSPWHTVTAKDLTPAQPAGAATTTVTPPQPAGVTTDDNKISPLPLCAEKRANKKVPSFKIKPFVVPRLMPQRRDNIDDMTPLTKEQFDCVDHALYLHDAYYPSELSPQVYEGCMHDRTAGVVDDPDDSNQHIVDFEPSLNKQLDDDELSIHQSLDPLDPQRWYHDNESLDTHDQYAYDFACERYEAEHVDDVIHHFTHFDFHKDYVNWQRPVGNDSDSDGDGHFLNTSYGAYSADTHERAFCHEG